METRHFCVHIGLSKTATTTLQSQVFNHHSQIEYLGKYIKKPLSGSLKYRDQQTDGILKEILRKNLDNKRMAELKKICDEYVLPQYDGNKLLLISSEGVSSGPSVNRYLRALNLKEVFGSCKIMIVLREPLSLIESLYFQKLKESNIRKKAFYVKCPNYFTINQWLERYWRPTLSGPLWNIDYYQTIQIFSSVFEKSCVGIFLYEQLKANFSNFMNNVSMFMGVDAEESLRLLSGQKENTRWSNDVLFRLEKIQKSFIRSLKFRLSSPAVRKKKLGIEKGSSLNGLEKARAVISDTWKMRINEYTRPGNRILEREWGLPLAEYGYPV